jgi:PAS domain S-box-containing protein
VIDLSQYNFEILRKDDAFALYRGRNDAGAVLVVSPVGERPSPENLPRLEHEYSLRNELDSAWAIRPSAITRHWDRPVLVLNDPGGAPLDQLLAPTRTPSSFVLSTPTSTVKSGSADLGGQTLGLSSFLQLAISLSTTIERLHQRGVVHKDIKPANVFADIANARCWLTGFGIASRLPREHQAPEPPEFIAGTLPYIAPEQTGRMNRSIDSRSDLYSLGVTLYEMLTGSLPFTASDPMEWVHCHIARQPVPPGERRSEVPDTVSSIVLKLLSKTAEDRYQTAAGLVADLGICLAEWESHRTVSSFSLGAHDISDRLLMPEKLYGRDREIKTLLDAFDQVVATGRPNLVLVSGYSGIGKSSVVNELHKVLVPPRGIFASGKFEQYKRDIPYTTLAQAFQSLVHALLGKSEAELRNWRGALREALGPNGSLIVDLVPELKLIIGEQPPVPSLPPNDAQRRFQLVFRRFICVFARAEHPLALFLDDLQWLDAATLDLLEDLLSQPDLQHLMLIGAYRDNEVNSAHPLMSKLERIRQAGAIVQEIVLAPLTCEDLGRLIADSLQCESERVTSLAQLIHEKTAGNPFFAIQFISALAEEALLSFDHRSRRWAWDLDRIHAKGYTENVVDFMVGKLNRLPLQTQKALQEFACLGNSAEITTLSIVHGTSEEELHLDLWEAVRLEFIVRLERAYRFVHDKVQEAAYSLIPEQFRAESHLRIGRLLIAHTSPEKRDEAIFVIVNQLNRGAALTASQGERDQIAELDLIAGKRAKDSTAYASALNYLIAGAALLADDSWERRHELTFALELHRAECEFLTGELAAAEERLTLLSSRAANIVEQSTVTCLRVDLYTTLDQSDRAVDVSLDYLRYRGLEWSPHPAAEEGQREYERIWKKLGGRAIEELIDLPLMSDPASLATMDVLIKVSSPALFTDANLFSLVICRAVNLSLEHGSSDGSSFAYVLLGIIAGPHFGNYKAGFRFGRLGYELVEKRGLRRFQVRTYVGFALVMPWTQHVNTSRDLLCRAFDTANKIGDLTFAAYSRADLATTLLGAGDSLVEVQRESEDGLEFSQKARFGLVIDRITGQLGLIRTLRGLTHKFGSFDDEQFDELRFERHLAGNPALAQPECFYWIRKLQARLFAGDYASAVDASLWAQQLLWTASSFFEMAEYHFYGALARAASCGSATGDQRQRHFEALSAHHRQLEVWAENCPENFENRAALVGAEIARIEGRSLDAMDLYEQAIRSARANGFVPNEALANELAARFYAARGFEKITNAYLRDARYGYLRWGADGKVRQLDNLYPQLKGEAPILRSTSTIGTAVDQLDLATVIRVSQAVSGEIVSEKLIDMLMRTAIENAGAERGLLLLSRGPELRLEAEAVTSGDGIVVRVADTFPDPPAAPESIINYVARTQEATILDDAQHSISADGYITQQKVRSILCLPLINQTKLTGVLYLENKLTPNVFTPARISVLKLLASQAAISLENTRLYHDLEVREAKIRRLVDANIMGLVIFNLRGEIIEANEAFLRMVGYSREDLLSGQVHWTDLTPVEWRDRNERALAELAATGIFQPFEKEYFRKDGSRAPVMIGGAMFEGSNDEGVAFALDLSKQKHAEEALQKVQAELAHVARMTTLGELSASITHEIVQPLSAIGTNADASLRWLAGDSPDLEEVSKAIHRITRDAKRASAVVSRMRALFKKLPAAKEPLDINELIQEVLVLTQSEVKKNLVSLRIRFANDLPLVMGDKIQLQQVILNLLINAIQAMSGVADGPRDLEVSSEKVVRTQGGSRQGRYEEGFLGESDGNEVLITVRDSGPGLDPQRLDHLFDAFYTTKPQGMGMGLSISRSIIEAHNGQIWASANSPRGAVFQFTLPIQE